MENQPGGKKAPRVAWILILLADIGLGAWGAMAALAPEHLLGPRSVPILQAEYQSYTGLSWPELTNATPRVADFMTILFHMYGTFNLAFAFMAIMITLTAFRRGERWAWWTLLVGNTLTYVAAMTFDRVVNAIGIFELTEYLGLAVAYLGLLWTWPFKKRIA